MQTKSGFTKAGVTPMIINKKHLLYKDLISQRINELINRVKHGVLHTHIMNEINNYPSLSNIDISEEVYTNTKGDVSIYINFYKGKLSYAHLSFHLSEANFDDNLPGPIHLTLTPSTIKKYIKLNISKENGILEIKYHIPDNNIDQIEQEIKSHPEYNMVLSIIGKYFNKADTYYYLDSRLVKDWIWNSNTNKIIKTRKKTNFLLKISNLILRKRVSI